MNLFNKNKVKIIYVRRDKRIKTLKVTPDPEGNFKVDNQTFKIDDNPYYDKKRMPTYFFMYQGVGPVNINVKMGEIQPSHMTPSQYNTAIDNKLARELFAAGDTGMDAKNISMIIGVATILILILGLYFIYTDVSETLRILIEIYGRVE